MNRRSVDRRSFLELPPSRQGPLARLAPPFPCSRAQQAAIPPYRPRDWSGGTRRSGIPTADIIVLDPRFSRYVLFNTPIRRHYTGTLWAEGPAWNGVGRYLVWSDIPNNRQMRWIEDDGRVTEFRNPSGYSNGNTFDHEGRQLSCEHGGRRVARYEQSGEVTVIADSYEGRPLNSPNDVVVHPDRSIWFTDPPYGVRGDYEGFRAEAELPLSVYRVDGQTGEIARVTDDIGAPNGHLLLAGLRAVVRGRHRERAGHPDLGRRRGDSLRNGRRHAQLTMLGDPGDGVRRRRHAVRRRREHLGRRPPRRAGHRAGRRHHRRHPAARGVRQRLLRRGRSAIACS